MSANTTQQISDTYKKGQGFKFSPFLFIFILLGIFLRAYTVLNTPDHAPEADVTAGRAALEAQAARTISEVAGQIEDMEQAEAEERAREAEEIAREEARQQAIEEGRGLEEDLYNTMKVRDADELRKTLVDNNAYCLGDSMVEGLHDGAFVNDSSLLYHRGGSVLNSAELFYTAIDLRPSILFITFGVNEPSTYRGDIQAFKDRYEELLNLLKDNLPDCRIYIHKMYPLQMDVVEQEDHNLYIYFDQYNQAIEEVAEECGVGLIDHTTLIAGHDELYWKDGQHPVSKVYVWFLSHDCYVAGI